LAIPICELKKAVRLGASLFGLDTNAIASHLQNLRPVIGRVKTGDIMAVRKKAKSRVNEAGNYTKPAMRKRLFNKIKAGGKGGKPGQWSARKAQMLAKQYKAAGGGYKS
jgi:hypothetical protein|tara:strand:- start:32 stop:358 length:327 start_codon:yes stop_codon:yes gene_type:complete